MNYFRWTPECLNVNVWFNVIESKKRMVLPLFLLLCTLLISGKFRSSRPEVFGIKSVLESFPKFIRKCLRQSLFFNKVAGLRPATLFEKRLWHRCFPMNFAKVSRTPFFNRTPPVAASENSINTTLEILNNKVDAVTIITLKPLLS